LIVDEQMDWLELLRSEVEKTSQSKVAKRLGVSAAMVSQALNGIYPGDMEKLKGRALGELAGLQVHCPVVGDISRRLCLDWQARPFAVTNPTRVRVYKACRSGCEHSFLGEEF
jgi:hypothetical protein